MTLTLGINTAMQTAMYPSDLLVLHLIGIRCSYMGLNQKNCNSTHHFPFCDYSDHCGICLVFENQCLEEMHTENTSS